MNTHTRIYAILHGIRKAGGRPHKEKDNRMDQRAENELQHPPCKKTQMTHQSNLPNGLLQKNNQSHERIWKRIAMPWNDVGFRVSFVEKLLDMLVGRI